MAFLWLCFLVTVEIFVIVVIIILLFFGVVWWFLIIIEVALQLPVLTSTSQLFAYFVFKDLEQKKKKTYITIRISKTNECR